MGKILNETLVENIENIENTENIEIL